MSADGFAEWGWARFPAEPALTAWIAAAAPAAERIVSDPRTEIRCGGTWAPGVNALPNDRDGRIGGGPPLSGAAVDFALGCAGRDSIVWDQGQLSVVWPGYPKPWDGESAAAHRFRRDRDAAHLDGLLPVGPSRRRRPMERHAFILGVQLPPDPPTGASPFVVWEGSHEILRAALRSALAGVAPQEWPNVDLTDAYQAARRDCFERCERREIPLAAGEAVVAHRLLLHGVAPWAADAAAAPRAVAYFRPDPEPDAVAWWLERP